MTDQDKAEKNRRLAEWLEPRPTWENTCRGLSPKRAWERRRLREWRDGRAQGYWDIQPVDFYLSEEASALLLEKMAVSLYGADVRLSWDGHKWTCYHYRYKGESADRKTAIAEAALRLMESEKK